MGELRGYLSLPNIPLNKLSLPLVVVFPDWDGVNTYEKKRATMISDQLNYISFAADIYGKDLQDNLSFPERIALSTKYRSNIPLYVQRMQRAIDIAIENSNVDVDKIALIGYCFGGSGVVQFALSGMDTAQIVVSFHGGFFNDNDDVISNADNIYPYTLILSGGDDPQHGDQTILENVLNNGDANWEITSYSNVGHGFTNWDSSAYNVVADTRSWESMKEVFHELFNDDDTDDNIFA